MKKLITPYCADFGHPNIVIKNFPDTESYVLIPKINSLKGKQVTIYHRLYPEPEKRFFELLLILSRIKGLPKKIELFIPYLPYARQDRESKHGEAVSADMLCEILKNCEVKKLVTYDCHFLLKTGNATRNGLKIENRSAGKELLIYAKKYFKKIDPKRELCVISPDQGSSYFIENAKGHNGHSLIKKRKRNNKHGLETEIKSIECDADVRGKNICILDDIIATGGTIIHATKHLKKLGAKKIIVGATHGVFAGNQVAEKILRNSCDKIFVTNSIQQKNSLLGILSIKHI